jgi:hypothetical protein
MADRFADIARALNERGMSAYCQSRNQLVVSRQLGAAWPDRGNSFWICRLADDWYVGTWTPYYYRVPASSSVVDVAEAFVDVGTSAQYRVPPNLISRFGLVETDYDEFERLFEQEGEA